MKEALDNRAILRAAAMMYDQGRAQEAQKIMVKLMNDKKVDSRTRFNAAKHIEDHNFRCFEHDNPATQKSEIDGTINININSTPGKEIKV
jgi:hypothetical protein